MHASIEQLLDIRDGLESPMTEHVNSCEHCQAELASIEQVSNQLFDVYDSAPNDEIWSRILKESELKSEDSNVHFIETAKHNNSLSRAIYTLAASVAFVGLVSVFMISKQNDSARQQADRMQAGINQLMLNSQGLENVLQQVMVNSDRLNVRDRAVAERLYSKLTYVDQELHETTSDAPEDAERIQILWSDRVEVLNELNRLFYQRKDVLMNAEY